MEIFYREEESAKEGERNIEMWLGCSKFGQKEAASF